MIKRILTGKLMVILCCLHAWGQKSVFVCAEDSTSCSPGVEGKSCSKAVSLEYEIMPGFTVHSESDDPNIGDQSARIERNYRFEADLKFPIINKPRTKMAGGIEYSFERYRFESEDALSYELFGSLQENTLKSLTTKLYFTQSINERFYIASAFKFSVRGDYSGFLEFNSTYYTYTGALSFGWKKNENLEIGAGILYQNSFGYHSIYPVFVYNQTFSPKWGIEMALPAHAHVRYNVSPQTKLLVGAQGVSNSYQMTIANTVTDEAIQLRMNKQEVRLGGKIQQNLVSYLWMGLDAGYSQSLGWDFDRLNTSGQDNFIEVDSYKGFYGQISLFLSKPPK